MRKLYCIIAYIIPSLVLGQQFEKTTNTPITEGEHSSRAATFADVNGDGHLDVYITNGLEDGENNLLYINDGNGNFTQNTTSAIARDRKPSDGATWGDVDNDGDLDLYVANWYGEGNLFYINDGDGNFTFRTVTSGALGGFSETASWGDLNNDGFLDLYVTNSPLSGGARNFYFESNGDGSYTQMTSDINQDFNNTRSVNIIDFDTDGDMDLFISNESNSANNLYVNSDNVFANYAGTNIVNDANNSTGSSWADYDNDGDFDLYVGNFNQLNALYRNDGDEFTKVTNSGLTDTFEPSFGTIWGDVDNDGDLDLFEANGSFNSSVRNRNYLYLNNGDGTFTSVEDEYISSEDGWSFGAALGDYDKDGFLDLIVARTYNQAQSNLLYHNLGNESNWINIFCVGTVTNKAAIGTRVRAKATIFGEEVWQMREISGQSAYNCQNSLNVHFGFGDATIIDELIVEWPSGQTTNLQNVAVNEFITIEETLPDGFIRANFTMDKGEFIVGDEVTFKNLTFSDDSYGLTYEWDFDSDGTIDSNEENPTYLYSESGTFDVTLTVKNDINSNSKVRSQYVTIGNITSSKDNGHGSIHIYPVPARSNINVNGVNPGNVVQLLSLGGEVLKQQIAKNKNISINTDDLKTGIYLVYIISPDGLQWRKISKI